MPTDRLHLILIAAAAGALGGCATGQDQLGKALGADPSWGEANRQTMAAQIIDPGPQYDTAIPKGTGTTAAAAIERYRTDKVKKPDRSITSRFPTTAAN